MRGTGIDYRPHLDGVRALAVGAVLGFHFFPSVLPGGFIGVDVFFVLSGYLITSISLSRVQRNTFSAMDFYRRRILRIFPSLLLVLIFTAALGALTLFPEELEVLGRHIFGGTAFVSNLIYMFESGYFDQSADTKPLLHLWSLGVEEQFYLLFPLLFLLFLRIKSSGTRILALAAFFLISFGFNLIEITRSSSVAFYFPISRFWEFLAGAALAFIPVLAIDKQRRVFCNCLGAISFILFTSVVFIKIPQSEFPGYWALLPVAASIGLIMFGSATKFPRVFLENIWVVYFGKISFPLYLWHWVLLSFSRIFSNGDLTIRDTVVVVVLTFLLSVATHELIERRIQGVKKAPELLIGLSLFIAMLGGFFVFSGGLPQRPIADGSVSLSKGFDGGFQGLEVYCKSDKAEEFIQSFTCHQDSRGVARSVIIGDSKAGAVAPALFRSSLPNNRWMYFGSSPNFSLLPLVTTSRVYFSGPSAKPESSLIPLQMIKDNPEIKNVVIASGTRVLFQLKNDSDILDLQTSMNYQVALDGLQKYVKSLTASNKKVFLLVDNPTLPHPEFCLSRKTGIFAFDWLFSKSNEDCSMPFTNFEDDRALYMKLLKSVVDSDPENIKIIDATSVYCHGYSTCDSVIDSNFPMYGHTDHVSDYAANYVAKIIIDSVK